MLGLQYPVHCIREVLPKTSQAPLCGSASISCCRSGYTLSQALGIDTPYCSALGPLFASLIAGRSEAAWIGSQLRLFQSAIMQTSMLGFSRGIGLKAHQIFASAHRHCQTNDHDDGDEPVFHCCLPSFSTLRWARPLAAF